MTTTRTDVHRPASPDFDPEAYELHGVFDLRPEWPSPEDTRYRLEVVNGLVSQGYRFGGARGGQVCGHCGTPIRYAALMARADVRQMIYVGETCLDNRFDLTKAEFARLREDARLNRARATKAERIEALVADHPLLAWLTYPAALDGNDFLLDVGGRFRRDGELSDRQVEAVEAAIIRDTERRLEREAREAAKAALAASGVQAPEGRVVVEGEVVSLKWQDNAYGGAWKMVVATAEGWAVWTTRPAALDGVEKGDRVRFSATLERSDRDPLFAFAKRPTKAEVLAPAAA